MSDLVIRCPHCGNDEFRSKITDNTISLMCPKCSNFFDLTQPKPPGWTTEDVLTAYRALHDGLSDMIEGGRLSEGMIPDDYQWLTTKMADIAGMDPK